MLNYNNINYNKILRNLNISLGESKLKHGLNDYLLMKVLLFFTLYK